MKKKGINKLCYGALLVLSITFSLFAGLYSGDVKALKHEFYSLPILTQVLPPVALDSNTNEYYFDWNDTSSYSMVPFGTGFNLEFKGDSWNDSLTGLRTRNSYHTVHTLSSNGQCVYNGNSGGLGAFFQGDNSTNLRSAGIDRDHPVISTGSNDLFTSALPSALSDGHYVVSYYYNNFPNDCYNFFGSDHFNISSYDALYNNGLPGYPNGAEPLIYNVATVLNNDNVFPYNFYDSSIDFQSSSQQSDGVVYEKRLSFDTIFNQEIHSFSRLQMGLDNFNGYWYDSSNLYAGRSIDFHFLFRFDSSFTLAQSFIDSGSLKLRASAQRRVYNVSNHSNHMLEYNCTSTVRVVGENQDYYWDISCPVTLDYSYIYWVPQLYIDGNGNKVFSTDGNWYFSSLYVVTDHDDTPGEPFNAVHSGNHSFWDTYWRQTDTQYTDANWFESLTHLFSFNFTNPFAPIFAMFTDQSQCANIPTMAGMLHLENPQVCPWFDSTTRSIATPVIGLASAMLVFGFAVRWLGSRSGNFIEDSPSDTGEKYSFHNKYRRK